MTKAELQKLTIAELRAYAKKNKINLEGRDKKADIVATILGGDVTVPEGQKHIDDAAKDLKANLKELGK